MSQHQFITLSEQERLAYLQKSYSKQLIAYASHQWKLSQDDAWELVYQTFIGLSIKADLVLNDEQHLKNYLFRAFINRLKNLNRVQSSERVLEYRSDLSTVKVSTEVKEKMSPHAIALENALDKMEDWQRILLLLRAQDMPYKEIAVYVQKPKNQLKVYYRRLLERLEITIEKELSLLKFEQS